MRIIDACDLFTVVIKGTNLPCLPCDCNPDYGDDEGMLVYRSRRAAAASCCHQMDLYGIECEAICLSDILVERGGHVFLRGAK